MTVHQNQPGCVSHPGTPFGVPQLACVDDFLRAAPRRYAAALENAFQRVHAMLGFPLKAGKEEVSERIGALGHTLTSHAQWVALQVSERRRAKLLAKFELIERRGFRSREPSQLGGELNFVDSATHGRCGLAFTVMIHATGQASDHQAAHPAGLSLYRCAVVANAATTPGVEMGGRRAEAPQSSPLPRRPLEP